MHRLGASRFMMRGRLQATWFLPLCAVLLGFFVQPVAWASDRQPDPAAGANDAATTAATAPAGATAEAPVDAAPADGKIADFAFVHFSDTHFGPYLDRLGAPGAVRGAETVAWINAEAARPQTMPVYNGIVTPKPAFALVTGDLTEYGVIDHTYDVFEKTWQALGLPIYVTTGNHDNTWVAMYHLMRKHYGSENYSFEQAGCHFVCLSSASPQEPLPTLDGKARAFLQADLAKVAPETPVFVAFHHPPYGDEFANPCEAETLFDLLRDHNTVLILYGHGHGVSHWESDGLDGVMGGSTFGPNAGYAVVSVIDDTLRVAYRYQNGPPKKKGQAETSEPAELTPAQQWRAVFKKPIERRTPRRLFSISSPAPRAVVERAGFELILVAPGITPDDVRKFEVRIDGAACKTTALQAQDKDRLTCRVELPDGQAGTRFLCARLTLKDKRADLRTTTLVVDDGPLTAAWQQQFPAAFKAAPVVHGETLIVAGTDGVVRGLSRADGREQWQFVTGGEVLGTPAITAAGAADFVLIVGSGDGKVYAIDAAAHEVWHYDAGAPVYSSPVVADGTVYVGDNGGRVHAIDAAKGQERWTWARADYAIESEPLVWGDKVVCGAWDGYIYAINRSDGTLAWKAYGPKSDANKGNRYWSPADCGPVAVGETLFVCDRGYQLGRYDVAGKLGPLLGENVAAIGLTPDGQGLLVRGLGGEKTPERISRLDADGKPVWQTEVAAGRFPIAPTCTGEALYVCSNRGLLSVCNLSDGEVRWQYQVTPGTYVMAPVGVDKAGVAYVAGMDGTLTAVRKR